MKKIEVRDQVRLPLRRCVQLCVRGIRYRLFRSSVTVVIVSLAVSFLMMMLSTSTVDREVARDVRARTSPLRLLEAWVDKLSTPMTGEALADRLAGGDARPGTATWRELRTWGGVSDEELMRLKRLAERQVEFLSFLAELNPAERSTLVGSAEGADALELLTRANQLEAFVAKVMNVGTVFGRGRAWLAETARMFAETRPLRRAICAGHARAVEALAGDLKGRTALELLGGPSEELFALLGRHGFELSRADYERLKGEARLALDERTLAAVLDNKIMRGVVAARVHVDFGDLAVGHLFELASGEKRARWLLEQAAEKRKDSQAEIARCRLDLARLDGLAAMPPERIASLARGGSATAPAGPSGAGWTPAALGELVRYRRIGRQVASRADVTAARVGPEHLLAIAADPEGARWLQKLIPAAREGIQGRILEVRDALPEVPPLSAERIAEVASHKLRMSRLSELEAALPETTGGWMGFTGRTGWLIVISFLVCVVGVANAMLMSVTERFREIATMKCLGAMDSFIMINFVLESSLLGLAGGIVGVVWGVLLGVLRSLWGFGGLALTNLPGALLAGSAGICLAAGVVLAAMAAVYPAWVAARLAPMEAMRIE